MTEEKTQHEKRIEYAKKGGQVSKKKAKIHDYFGEKYNAEEFAKKIRLDSSSVRRQLREGKSLFEIEIDSKQPRSIKIALANIDIMRCRVCGMEFNVTGHHQIYRKRTCGNTCTKMEKAYPEEFGLWWKE